MKQFNYGLTYHGRVHKTCGTTEKYISCGVCVACTRTRELFKRSQERLRSLRNKTIQLQESY